MAESATFVKGHIANNLDFVGHEGLCHILNSTNVKSILGLESHTEAGHWVDPASGYGL